MNHRVEMKTNFIYQDMDYTIENEYLRVVISSRGAEVQSVMRKSDGKELWWQGDPRFWDGRSPILFPACGGLWNGSYTYQGASYQMPKHGFVKDQEWEAVEPFSPDSVSFVFRSSEQTLSQYPFHFELQIKYRVLESQLECSYSVSNHESDRLMPFQIGGHPAIALPDYHEGAEVIGYIQPKGDSEIHAECLTVVRAGEQGCWSRPRYAVPSTWDGLIPISEETFANEALIFDHNQIHGVNILDLNREVLAQISSGAPVWLFWQQQNLLCPYICAEPWFGLCDLQGESVDLTERPYTLTVSPGNVVSDLLWKAIF